MNPEAQPCEPSVLQASTVILIMSLFIAGCGTRPVELSTPGKSEETWAYWRAFNKAAVGGVGIEVLQTEAYQEAVSIAGTCAVLEDVIVAENERKRIILSLPVLHVDADLTAYALEFAKCRSDLANALQDFVLLEKKQETITSEPVLGIGLIFNLLNHSDDKEDGILWRALLDEGRQTADRLGTLKQPAQALESKAAGLRAALGKLETKEMEVRIKLAQKFNKEFPPMKTYRNDSASTDKKLSEVQIMRTLIGHKIGDWPNRWTFADPKEFVTFKILYATNRTELIRDCLVNTHVKGIPSGAEHDFKLHLSYGRLHTRWKLIGIEVLSQN